ncbi:transferrin-like isoform X1 [Palaemon carinicauda]|uniref:transferrin-like isoform X1 n=1 Tax=Palaemon carinicauda TaxID=392227 RepID=UPI0035B66D94
MWIIPLTGLLLTWLTPAANGVRLCVTQQNADGCKALEAETQGNQLGVICVKARDRYDCLKKIVEDVADVMQAEPEDVYLAKSIYGTRLHVIAETRFEDEMAEPYRYKGVAIVRKLTIKEVANLKGSKSCHTGYGRTAGWNIPFSNLLEMGQIKLQCDERATVVEHDLKAASSYFGLACIPGKWVPDEETNAKLKETYNNLCNMCGGQCDGEDIHAGYEGALRCLVDSHGDVAWTKLSAVHEFFKKKKSVNQSDYGVLCPDGRILDLDDSQPCFWAARPWNAWIGRTEDGNKEHLVTVLKKAMESAKIQDEAGKESLKPWAKTALGIDTLSIIHAVSPSMTPMEFLNKTRYDRTIERLGCPEEPVKLCISSRSEYDKCGAMKHVFKSRRIRPHLECVNPSNDSCLPVLAQGRAQIAVLDQGDVYKGHLEYGFVPVVSERYGQLDASYFAVAVVRANSGITSLSQLKGKKSCHTGIDRTAGWKIPISALLEAGLLKPGDCDFAGEMGRFFSSSCAPGAKDPDYDVNGTNPASLCDLCIGTEVEGSSGPTYTVISAEGKCDRTNKEAFSGYTGAFRCLVQGGGDVAFVKHSTVVDNTNGNNNASWAKDLRALDFKLLCKSTGTADVIDFDTCNLARVPAHKVVTGIKSDKIMIEEIRIMLLRASDEFPKGQDVFTLFGEYEGHHDLIFKDSVTDLVNVREDEFHKSLDEAYYRAAQEISTCKPLVNEPKKPSLNNPVAELPEPSNDILENPVSDQQESSDDISTTSRASFNVGSWVVMCLAIVILLSPTGIP